MRTAALCIGSAISMHIDRGEGTEGTAAPALAAPPPSVRSPLLPTRPRALALPSHRPLRPSRRSRGLASPSAVYLPFLVRNPIPPPRSPPPSGATLSTRGLAASLVSAALPADPTLCGAGLAASHGRYGLLTFESTLCGAGLAASHGRYGLRTAESTLCGAGLAASLLVTVTRDESDASAPGLAGLLIFFYRSW
jgi:hypothetical protein